MGNWFVLGLPVGSEHVSEKDGVTECVCLALAQGALQAACIIVPPSLPPDIQYQGKKPTESAWNRQQDKSDSAVTEISELLDSSQAKL